MSDPNEPQGDLLEQAKAEISGMVEQKLDHPSTKPVLAGAAIGAVVGIFTPVSIPLGIIAGAGIAFWMRLKR